MPLKTRDESIRKSFSLSIGWVLFLGTVALSATIAINEGLNQYRILEQKGLGFARYIAKLGQDPLIAGDRVQLDSIVYEAQQDNELLYSIICDARGKIVTSQFASINYKSSHIREIKAQFKGADDMDAVIGRIKANGASFEVSAPIVTGSDTVGRVVIGLSKHNILHNIFVTVSVVILLNIVIALALAVTLLKVSRRIVFTPMTALAEAAQRLARGDLGTRIDAPASGEVLLLQESFNRMAADLQRTTVSREYMDNVISSMTEALIIVAPDLSIRDVNPAATGLSGYQRQELLGQPVSMIMDETPLRQLLASPGDGVAIGIETWCRTRSGEELPIHLAASPMLGEEGAPAGIVCNVLDISALRQAARQLKTAYADLERQKEALETANQELEAFCYSVSHDLRAPLRHINGYAGMLREEYNDAQRQAQWFIDKICGASNRMGALIDDLLSFSRVSRTEMRQVTADLSGLAAREVELLQSLEPGRRVEVVIEPGLTARGDENLLQLVLQNLIGNAWKYSSRNPAARIEVGRAPAAGRDAFFVRDNGIGFDMTYGHKLFRVFERLHGDDFEGTGIGLATVQRIIHRHGGEVWAEGEPDKGAVFYFTLP